MDIGDDHRCRALFNRAGKFFQLKFGLFAFGDVLAEQGASHQLPVFILNRVKTALIDNTIEGVFKIHQSACSHNPVKICLAGGADFTGQQVEIASACNLIRVFLKSVGGGGIDC